MSDLATSFAASLPEWIHAELDAAPAAFAGDEQAMAFVNRLASLNHRGGSGGPFAAIVIETESGALVSAGVNVVLSSGLSSLHAEVMALTLAQRGLGRWDLGDPGHPRHALVVNWRPCVMCGGAALWSGVGTIVIAGDGPELEQLTGFDEGPAHPRWADEMRARGVEVRAGVGRDEALAVFAEYGARDDVVVYNARGAGRREPPGS